MPFQETIRPLLPLAIGLAIGGAGVTLFQQSMPGDPGSPEERAELLEVRLKAAENRVRSLEAEDPNGRRRPGGTFRDRASRIAEDLREGRDVNPDDVFRAFQPVMRDLAPLFDRMRMKQDKDEIERRVGNYAREYDLTPAQQDGLRKWFSVRSEENAEAYSKLVQQEGTRLEDLMKFSMESRPDEGLDGFMAKTLSGDKLSRYQTERMAERSGNVQNEADARVERLNGIVSLDDAQRDAVFGIAARDSDDYDPAMGIEGADGSAVGAAPGTTSEEAMLAVLRQDQRQAYEAEKVRRREETRKEMESFGLTMPPGWDMLDSQGF
jgi:hypothetical protein